jgi:hypothetical protein
MKKMGIYSSLSRHDPPHPEPCILGEDTPGERGGSPRPGIVILGTDNWQPATFMGKSVAFFVFQVLLPGFMAEEVVHPNLVGDDNGYKG